MESNRKICQFCHNSYTNLRTHQQNAKFCLKIQGKTSTTPKYKEKLRDQKNAKRTDDTLDKTISSIDDLTPLTNEFLKTLSSRFTIQNLLDGADGHINYCFNHVFSQDRYLELSSSKRKVIFVTNDGTKSMDSKLLSSNIVSSLKNQSIKLAREHLPKLFTKRDEIMRSSTNNSLEDVVDELEEINIDISILIQIQECYEENFDDEYHKLLSSKIIKELKIITPEDH